MKLSDILTLDLTKESDIELFYKIVDSYNLSKKDKKDLFVTLKKQARWK